MKCGGLTIRDQHEYLKGDKRHKAAPNHSKNNDYLSFLVTSGWMFQVFQLSAYFAWTRAKTNLCGCPLAHSRREQEHVGHQSASDADPFCIKCNNPRKLRPFVQQWFSFELKIENDGIKTCDSHAISGSVGLALRFFGT